MKITSDQLSRIYFERKPPYSEEAILKAKQKDYKVEYAMKKEYVETKQVTETKDQQKSSNGDKTPLKKDELLFKVSEIMKKNPDFQYMNEKDKMLVVSDIINGKYDNIIEETPPT